MGGRSVLPPAFQVSKSLIFKCNEHWCIYLFFFSTFRQWWPAMTGVYDMLDLWRLQLLGKEPERFGLAYLKDGFLWIFLVGDAKGTRENCRVSFFSLQSQKGAYNHFVAWWRPCSTIHTLGFDMLLVNVCEYYHQVLQCLVWFLISLPEVSYVRIWRFGLLVGCVNYTLTNRFVWPEGNYTAAISSKTIRSAHTCSGRSWTKVLSLCSATTLCHWFFLKKSTCSRRCHSYQLLRKRRTGYSPTVSRPFSGTSVEIAE